MGNPFNLRSQVALLIGLFIIGAVLYFQEAKDLMGADDDDLELQEDSGPITRLPTAAPILRTRKEPRPTQLPAYISESFTKSTGEKSKNSRKPTALSTKKNTSSANHTNSSIPETSPAKWTNSTASTAKPTSLGKETNIPSPAPTKLSTNDTAKESLDLLKFGFRVKNDARPRGLRMAFMGDSVTRYQYVSLAFFLHTGHWYPPKKIDPHIVNEHTYGTYQAFFEGSTTTLRPYERCDCYRPEGEMLEFIDTVTENRYYWEPTRDNVLVYINAYGHVSHPHGRYHPEDALKGIPDFQYVHDDYSRDQYKWMTNDWGWIVRNHLGKLDPPLTHIVFNAGIWPNNFGTNQTAREDLLQALDETNITGIWKTTSVHVWGGPWPGANVTDDAMCPLFRDCINITWTGKVWGEYSYDGIHYMEPIYRIINEELLETVGHEFPTNYSKIDLSLYLQPDA